MPSMSRMQAAGDVRGMMEMNSRANVMVGTLLYPLLAFAFVFAEDIVTLVYTAAYVEAAPVMRVYIVGMAGAWSIEVGSIMLLLRQGAFALRITRWRSSSRWRSAGRAAHCLGLAGAAAGSVTRHLPRPHAHPAPHRAPHRHPAARAAGLALRLLPRSRRRLRRRLPGAVCHGVLAGARELARVVAGAAA